jgi:polysaccharide transporter, PST family
MIEDLRNIPSRFFSHKDHRRLFNNFLSLSTLNALNLLLPLATLPYLVRVLGPEKYGIVSFAYALMVYFLLVANYGFQLSATQWISISREDPRKTNEIFSTVIAIRILLAVAGFAVLLVLTSFVKPFSDDPAVYFYSFGFVAGLCLIPSWYFQGIEKMHFVTVVNVIPRVIFTVLIFVFIHGPEDYRYVNLLNSIGAVIGGVASIILAVRKFGIRLVFPSLKTIGYYLRSGWNIFVSTVSISLYRESNTFLLGLFTNYSVVAYYSAAEKIIKAIQSVLNPVSESLFPYISHRFSNEPDRAKNITVLKRIGKYYGAVLLVLSVLLLLFAPLVSGVLLGKGFVSSVLDLRIMSLVILFGGLNYLFGIIGLINLGASKYFTRAVLVSGLVSLAFTILLSPYLVDRAASMALLLSEILLLVQVIWYLSKVQRQPLQTSAV